MNYFMKIVTRSVFVIGIILISAMTSFWWNAEEPNILRASLLLISLWVIVFNFLPLSGFKCLKEPFVMFFSLPVSVISTLLYLYGVITTHT